MSDLPQFPIPTFLSLYSKKTVCETERKEEGKKGIEPEMEGDNNSSSNSLYRECLRNHAANLGSYATDGCGEFTPEETAGGGNLQCAACGCHRNFHRRVMSTSCGPSSYSFRGPDQEPNEMLDYSGGAGIQVGVEGSPESGERSSKKRYRTKFTAEQKEKMLGFAEKLGWKLQRRDEEDEVERFCRGVGISRKVFKVWMHNHKSSNSAASAITANASSLSQS